MKDKKLKFNIFYNEQGEELEKLVIKALINYKKSNENSRLTKC